MGDFLVTWRDQRDGDRGGMFARLFDRIAQPRGGDFQVNTYTLAQQDVPATARHPSGRTLVVWQSGVSFEAAGQDASAGGIVWIEGLDVRARVFDANATPLGSELTVGDASKLKPYVLESPTLAVPSSGAADGRGGQDLPAGEPVSIRVMISSSLVSVRPNLSIRPLPSRASYVAFPIRRSPSYMRTSAYSR